MTHLGNHVFRSGDKLINLTTRVALPLSADNDELNKHFFLEGQERDAIIEGLMLFKKRHVRYTHIDVIPTWRCNLRCSHCFVLHKLQKKGDNDIDPQQLVGFITRLKAVHPELERVNIVFLGGEATLHPQLCLDIIDVTKKIPNIIFNYDMTSNGIIMNQKVLELYSKLDKFMISLDGVPETHNTQRISLDQHDSPYDITLNNIRRLVKFGLRSRIKVQSSLPLSVLNNNKGLARLFYKAMLKAGVLLENINFGYTSPTRKNPGIDPTFKARMSHVEYLRPCCKYRMDTHYIVDDGGTVYADYFEDHSETYLGKLTDDIETINKNHAKVIMDKIPVLNDEKCTKCPVVGMCWGWCANTHNHFIKPSEYCSQQLLQESVLESSRNGALESRLYGGKAYKSDDTPNAF